MDWLKDFIEGASYQDLEYSLWVSRFFFLYNKSILSSTNYTSFVSISSFTVFIYIFCLTLCLFNFLFYSSHLNIQILQIFIFQFSIHFRQLRKLTIIHLTYKKCFYQLKQYFQFQILLCLQNLCVLCSFIFMENLYISGLQTQYLYFWSSNFRVISKETFGHEFKMFSLLLRSTTVVLFL